MSSETFKLKQQSFNAALHKLEEALNEPASEYLRDASIQRFEFTYELAWKTLKAYLSSKDIIVLSPKETLQIAYQQGLLHNANAWSELHMKRNLTSHTYDEKLAEEIYIYLKNEGLSLFLELKHTLAQLT